MLKQYPLKNDSKSWPGFGEDFSAHEIHKN